MLLLPSLPMPLPPTLAPLLESPPWLFTPTVLLSLLTSLQWLQPGLTTSPSRVEMEKKSKNQLVCYPSSNLVI